MTTETMTNEELVRRIQAGETEWIPQLWEQIHRFIRQQAKIRLAGQPLHIQIQLEDDLVNEGYFGMIKAVKTFNAKHARFLTYLQFFLSKCFNQALGIPVSGNKDLIETALRLDMETPDAEDLALIDLIVDPVAEAAYTDLEDDSFWMDVHNVLKKAIKTKMTGEMRELFLVILEHGCGVTEACRILGIPLERRHQIRNMQNNGMRILGQYFKTEKEERKSIGIDEYFRMGFRGTGVRSFKEHGFTSATERLAIRNADQDLARKRAAERVQKAEVWFTHHNLQHITENGGGVRE